MIARKVKMNTASTYYLRSYGVWPKMAWLTVTRILPIAASPIVANPARLVATYDNGPVPSDLPLILEGFALLGIGAAGFTGLLQIKKWDWHTLTKFFYPVATILIFVLMIPSWRVNSDYSVRYIIPMLPGLWVFVCLGVERLAG